MIKLYLITGFLGAGKTTLLKNMIDIVVLPNNKISVIVNEFGKQGIDGSLVKTVGVHVDEINNGSIFCACRLDKFESVLLSHISNSPPDIILVEASGLSDPTSIKKILSSNEKFNQIEYMGCICLVDAVNFKKVLHTAKVCKRQISISDIVIINKLDLVSTAQVEEIEHIIFEQKPSSKIYRTSFGKLSKEWIDNIQLTSVPIEGYHLKDVSLQKFLITIKDSFSHYQLVKFLEMFIESTYRIKGFVSLEGMTYLVDCAGVDVKVTPYSGETDGVNNIVVLSGAGMDTQKQINNAVKWYTDYIISVE